MEPAQTILAGVYPYYMQYEVRVCRKHQGPATFSGALATVIVFAEDGSLAEARASRHIARNNWEITAVKRSMPVQRHHIERMDGVLKSLYRKAEQAGIAVVFDSWKKVHG